MSHDEWWFGEFIVTRLQASNSRIIIQHAQHQKHPNSEQVFMKCKFLLYYRVLLRSQTGNGPERNCREYRKVILWMIFNLDVLL